MTFVVDASVVAKWVLDEPDSEAAVELGKYRLVAPAFLDIECGNILWKAVRRGFISPQQAAERLAVIGETAIERMPNAVLLPGAMRHALIVSHPIHDCLYVEAALWAKAPLVTADKRLARLEVEGCDIRLLGRSH